MDGWLIINIISAKDSLEFLVRWLDRFPWYKTRDIFITGESYAGHYVPQLAREILAYNAKSSHPIHLKGIMVTSSTFYVVLSSCLHVSLHIHFISTTLQYKDIHTYIILTRLKAERILTWHGKFILILHCECYWVLNGVCEWNVGWQCRNRQLLR